MVSRGGKTSRSVKKGLAFVEAVGLLVIAVATTIAGYQEVMVMIAAGRVLLVDLLLLFIYLEVLTMVALYWNSGRLPVRFPLYIGMVALARYLILDMKEMDEWRMLAVALSITLLSASVLLIRYGHVRFPYPQDDTRADASPDTLTGAAQQYGKE